MLPNAVSCTRDFARGAAKSHSQQIRRRNAVGVQPFLSTGVVRVKWGDTTQSYQALELRIYETPKRWDKRSGPLADLTNRKKNKFAQFEKKAKKLLREDAPRVFVVMPIQGEQHGDQEQQRVFREYDERFVAIEDVVRKFGCVAIRIDKEFPLDQIVGRIKQEIAASIFVIADLTDERPSCYFEAGYAEASPRPVIYVASKQSVLKPGTDTRIHFDIHMSIHQFTNHRELKTKLAAAIEKNKKKLFPTPETDVSFTVDLMSRHIIPTKLHLPRQKWRLQLPPRKLV